MNPPNRESWPQPQASSAASHHQAENQSQQSRPLGPFGSSGPAQQQAPPAPAATGTHVLPPPGPFYSTSTSQPSHNLSTLAGLTQGSSLSQRPTVGQEPQAGSLQHQPPGPPVQSYTLPAIATNMANQLPHQGMTESERDGEPREPRESAIIDDINRRHAEQREREARERQHAGEQQVLHQPVALVPSARTIHGPNGLLGNQSSPGVQHLPAPPNPPQAIFPSAAQTQGGLPGQPQPPLLMPFGPGPGPANQQGNAMNQAQQPILNDALSYLDQVKVQFSDQPDVYNRFLDIMKDFKSGVIDTPGVIERVSYLFAGNPSLIQGFNTFLPPGYKIECGMGDDPNSIRVTTPMGTTVSTMPARAPSRGLGMANGIHGGDRAYYEGAARLAWPPQQMPPAQESGFNQENRLPHPGYGGQAGPGPHGLSPEAHREQPVQPMMQQEQRSAPSSQTIQHSAPASSNRAATTGSSAGDAVAAIGSAQIANGAAVQMVMGANGSAEKRGPVEFNHAISYVNKIKNRFATQPDIYKQFLEILQTYQRESKPIGDVYAQVTRLFETAPDLLEDFKQFLPESAAHAKAAAGRPAEDAFPMSSTRTEPGYMPAGGQPVSHHTPRPDQPRMPPMGSFAPTPSSTKDNKRKRGVERPGQVSAAVVPEANNLSTARPSLSQGGPASKRQRTANTRQLEPSSVVPSLTVPPVPRPLAPTASYEATSDDLMWWERVRKHINNKAVYLEFCKLCNLYTQDIVTASFILHRAHPFIGTDPSLTNWLRDFLGVEGDDDENEVTPRAGASRVSLSRARGLGPSYRLLPKADTNQICSGRDELCWSVLNDQWASHATWESEESGFVAHKKTAYEESLSRIEEERHDYDSNIEVLDRTIQLLEPINKALDGMSLDAKKAYKIDMRLGGQSELLWKRVTFKLYGRESGQKVIESLEQSPYIVVPVLLQRFLTVREVWKSAQRHWQSVWRQQMNQFYHKSLDPQGANGKAASDKKQFTEKSLTGDIKIRYEDTKFHKARAEEQRRLQLREAAGNNGDVRRTSIPKVKDYQYLHKMENTPVVLDAARLVLTFMDHTYSADHPRLLIEMKDFLSLFFGIDRSLFKSALEDGDSPNSESSPAAESADSARPKKKGKNRLLKSALVQAGASASASASRDVTPGPASAPEEDATSANAEGSDAEKWFTAPAPVVVSGRAISFDEQFPRTEYHMYCNIPIYCFLHLLGTIYERLLLLLEYEDEVKAMAEMQKAPKAAHALDMIDATPDDFFRDTSSTANYYKQMLLLFEDHLRGSIDQTVVEDTLRRYYLPNGWRLYFIYYQIQSMAKFAFNFGGPDPKGRERTFEIIQLFKRNRVKEKTSLHDDLSYRQQVSKHLNVKEKETDLSYRITYNAQAKRMTIKVFEKDSATFDSFPNFDATKRWQHYVNAYASLEVTEGVNMTEAQWPVHARSVPTDRALDGDNEAATVPERSEEGLVFRITQQRKIHFAPHNIEWLLNYPSSRDLKTQKDKYEQRTQVGAEKYVTNNQWMQGRSRDFVDNIKAMAAAILQGEAAQEVQVTQEHGVAQDDSATQAQGTVPATDTAEEGGGADQQVDSNMSGTEN